jgi:hypothetical protein
MAKKKEGGAGLVGLGLAALAASAAAGYFLYGKDGAKNRKKISGWMLKAKGEVLEKVEKLKNVTEEDYNMAITMVADKYAKVKGIDPEEVKAVTDELRKHWKSIKKHIEPKKPAPKKKGAKKGPAKEKIVVVPVTK